MMLNVSNYVTKWTETGPPEGPIEYQMLKGDFLKQGTFHDAPVYNNCTKENCDPTFGMGGFVSKSSRRPNSAKLLRLAFHDCVSNIDENGVHFGGCDGCLNWEGMGFRMKEALKKRPKPFKYDIPTHGDNNALQSTVYVLELIYTNASWPEGSPKLPQSLRDSGKSRADLWQFAGLIALEQALERANRACDLDFHARQQV